MEYNVEKAKELLTEAGYPDGLEFTYTTYQTTLNQAFAEVLQSMWSQIGVKIKIDIVDLATFIDMNNSARLNGRPDDPQRTDCGSGGQPLFCGRSPAQFRCVTTISISRICWMRVRPHMTKQSVLQSIRNCRITCMQTPTPSRSLTRPSPLASMTMWTGLFSSQAWFPI